MPFLENVLRGRNVPRERMLEVAEHYYHFGGVSPINGQVRDLIAALEPELERHGVDLPVYWGNRNWHPMLADTLREMADDGVKHALGRRPGGLQLVFELPAVSRGHPQGPRGGRRRGPRGRQDAGLLQPPRLRRGQRRSRPRGPRADPRRPPRLGPTGLHGAQHPRRRWRRTATTTSSSRRPAGSSPRRSGVGPDRWSLVYQSRSGRPTDPWLGPDILDHLDDLNGRGRERRRRPAGRLPLRPHGGAVRPRRGGHAPGPSAGPEHGPGRDRRARIPRFVGDARAS